MDTLLYLLSDAFNKSLLLDLLLFHLLTQIKILDLPPFDNVFRRESVNHLLSCLLLGNNGRFIKTRKQGPAIDTAL